MDTLSELRRLQNKPGARLAEVFQEEEAYGLKLAALVRTMIITLLVCFVLVFAEFVNALYWISGSSLVVLLAWCHLYTRHKWSKARWTSYIYALLDFSAICIIALRPNLLIDSELVPQATNKVTVQSVILAIIAMYGLTGRPVLVIWAGVSAALCWGATMFYLLTLPETLSNSDREWAGIGIILDPYYIGLGQTLAEMTIYILVAGAIAVIVVRLRGLVAKRALVERERTNLSRYLPRELAETLAGRDNPLDAPKVRRVVVLFVDMIGFTRRAEALDPGATILLLRDFHGVLADCAFEFGGTLEKFLGDGMLVTFGRLAPDARDAANALGCARAMVQRVARWTEERGDRPPIKVGIGIHMGEVVIGNIGTSQRLEPAILGDVVNAASRIEALSRAFPYPILLSQDVREAAAGCAEGQDIVTQAKALGAQSIKGRGAALDLYGLMAEPPPS